jgi:hypothetical protein
MMSDGHSIERQDLELVSYEVGSILDDGLCDAIKVLDLIGFEVVQYLLQSIDKLNLLLSSE